MESKSLLTERKQQREGKPQSMATQFRLRIKDGGMPFINFFTTWLKKGNQ